MQVKYAQVWYLTVPEARTLLLLPFWLSLLITWGNSLSILTAAALLLVLHLLARLCPRIVFYRGWVFCISPVQGKRKHRVRKMRGVLRLQRWLQGLPWTKHLLKFSMENCKAKTKKWLVSLKHCVLFHAVIKFPPLHLRPQTYNHSKFSQSKNTRANHSVNYCTLSQKKHIQERFGKDIRYLL